MKIPYAHQDFHYIERKKMCSNLEQNFALFFCIEYLYFRDWVITIFIFLIESRDFFLSISV